MTCAKAGASFGHAARTAIGGALAISLAALSVACCFQFGRHLAPGDEGLLYGVLGATADALKALLPLAISAALISRQTGRAAIGVALFAVFSIYSFTSELGLYALSRDAVASTASAGKEAYGQLKEERARIQERLRALGQTRPSSAITAELDGQKQNAAWQSSKECTDATLPASRSFCAAVARLKGELETARGAEALRIKESDLSARINGMDLATVLKSTDAQTEALARLTGLAPGTIKDSLAILVALLIELGSGFGLFVVTASGTPPVSAKEVASPKEMVTPSARQPAEAAPDSDPEISAFVAARLEAAEGATVKPMEVFTAWRDWCKAQKREPGSQMAFWPRIKTRIEHNGNDRRPAFVGVRIRAAGAARLNLVRAR